MVSICSLIVYGNGFKFVLFLSKANISPVPYLYKFSVMIIL